MSTPIDTYPLDVKQFIVDTLRLPPIAKAAYLMIILDYCARGEAPPADQHVLGQITHADIKTLEYLIPLFDVRDGRWYHAGIEAEMARQAKVRSVAVNASKAAKDKRDQRKGLTQLIVEQSPLGQAATTVTITVPPPQPINTPPAAIQPPAPVDHPIPDDFALDGADIIQCQSAGAGTGEIAEWLDYFRQYHAEAGTLAVDWKALFHRFVGRKIEERDAKPKPKPRIEVSRRAPAPPGAA